MFPARTELLMLPIRIGFFMLPARIRLLMLPMIMGLFDVVSENWAFDDVANVNWDFDR